jgi:hypothetical protein
MNTTQAFTNQVGQSDRLIYNRASTGLYMDQLFKRLGLSESLESKTERFTNGDDDMAAAVIAHEVSHHTLGHRERGQSSQFALDLVTGILGVLADAAIQSRYNIQNSTIGRDIASVGSNLISSKFSRDYEREADENGFKYMVAAGYNPEGGLRLANSFIQKGFSSSSGWFNDTHPGWDERAERFKDKEGIALHKLAKLYISIGESEKAA